MAGKVEKDGKFEAFKTGLLKWKNEHREEYNEFARNMANCDEIHYLHIFKAVSTQMPKLAKEWDLSWGDDGDEMFGSMFLMVAKEDIPQQIADMFTVSVPYAEEKIGLIGMARRILGVKPKARVKLSAPLVLSWLFYGKSFESMVSMIEKQMSNRSIGRADMLKCSFAARSVIATSIRSGYRTKEDWERHFALEEAVKERGTGEWALHDVMRELQVKAAETTDVEAENIPHTTAGRKKSKECPLIDYLPADCSEAILSYLRRFIKEHPSATQQALPFFVLKEMQLRQPLCNGMEYGIAMTKQFPDVNELRSEHSLRQAVGKLAGTDTQMLVKDGKLQMCRYIESDENQKLLKQLRDDLANTVK